MNFSRHQKQLLQKHMVAFTKILSWTRTYHGETGHESLCIIGDFEPGDIWMIGDFCIIGDFCMTNFASLVILNLVIFGNLCFNLFQKNSHLKKSMFTILNRQQTMIVVIVVLSSY